MRKVGHKIVPLDHAGVGIVFLKARRILRCSKTFAAMFGYRLDELIGTSTRTLYLSQEAYETRGREAYAAVEAGGILRSRRATTSAARRLSVLCP